MSRKKSAEKKNHSRPGRAGAAQNKKPRRVKSLQKFLKAYGGGENGKKLREEFAKRIGTTLPYLVHLSYGYRTTSSKLAVDIERHTHGLVTVEELRPDIDWAYLRSTRPIQHAAAAAG